MMRILGENRGKLGVGKIGVEIGGTMGQPCAGISRHFVGDETALQESSSDSILTSSLAWTRREAVGEA
jgi:hypothetical protein